MPKSVLFVCFGNICRSTMAEALFNNYIKERGEMDEWVVDSAGHGHWHLGEHPEKRTLQVLEAHGITGYTHTARLMCVYFITFSRDQEDSACYQRIHSEIPKCFMLVNLTPLDQITLDDFKKFNYILGMDGYNLRNLNVMKPEGCKTEIQALGNFDPLGAKPISDPYFSNSIHTYEEVYQQCQRCCKAFLDHVSSLHKPQHGS